MSTDPIVFTTPAGTNSPAALAATAGNATGTIFTVPAGQRYFVLYGRSKLVADANAANRNIYLQVDDGSANIRWTSRGSTNISASQTKYVSWSTVYDTGGTEIDLNNQSIPNPLILEAGEKLLQIIQNGLAGDTHTAQFYVLKMAVKE